MKRVALLDTNVWVSALLNKVGMPARVVNGLAITPTMTFFAPHGGPSNEGNVPINGMTVVADSGSGGTLL